MPELTDWDLQDKDLSDRIYNAIYRLERRGQPLDPITILLIKEAARRLATTRLDSRSAGTAPRELGVRPLTEGPMSKGGQNIPEVDADGFIKCGPRPPTPQGSGGAAYRQSKECGE
jgi:hypothetical protein